MTTIQASNSATVDSTANVVTLSQTGNHGLSTGDSITITANGASATNMSDTNIFGVTIYVYVTGLSGDTFAISKNSSPAGANLITFTGDPGDQMLSPGGTATYAASGGSTGGGFTVKSSGTFTIKSNAKLTIS